MRTLTNNLKKAVVEWLAEMQAEYEQAIGVIEFLRKRKEGDCIESTGQ